MVTAPLETNNDEDHAALRYVAANAGASLCTIIGIDGSFSRRLGAQLAIGTDMHTVGSLSDGCLEMELANQARNGFGRAPRILRYGRGSPFIDFRLPCGSGLDILVDPTPDQDEIFGALKDLDARRPAAIRLPHDRSELLRHRKYLPPLKLKVFGSGPEAFWLEQLSRNFGIVTECYSPEGELSLGRIPSELSADRWTAIALLFHDHEWENSILDWALLTEAYFVGAIGGRVARDERANSLQSRGWASDDAARVRSPVGLIKHARDARVLALSILAEVVEAYECLKIVQP